MRMRVTMVGEYDVPDSDLEPADQAIRDQRRLTPATIVALCDDMTVEVQPVV